MQIVTDIPGLVRPIAMGRKVYGDPDSDGYDGGGRNWMLFPRLTAEQVRTVQNVYFTASYRGPGRHFSSVPDIKQTKRRTLFTQFTGRDI